MYLLTSMHSFFLPASFLPPSLSLFISFFLSSFLPVAETSCIELSCEHICQPFHNGRSECHCRQGYELAANGRSCLDVNECDSSPCPSQSNCLNTVGSFTCTCIVGTEEADDGSCVGKGCQRHSAHSNPTAQLIGQSS